MASDWVLIVTGRMASSVSAEQSAEARLMVDGADRGSAAVYESTGTGSSAIHFLDVVPGGAARTVQLQIRSVTGSSVSATTLSLVAFTLPTGADGLFAERSAAVALGPAFAPLAQLSLPAGDHLVLALGVIGGAGGSQLRLVAPSATWPATAGGFRVHNPASTWRSELLAHRVSLASPGVVSLEGGGTGTATLARVLAFRAAAFTHLQSFERAEHVPTAGNTSVELLRGTTPSSVATRQVVLYGLVMGGSPASAARIAEYGVNTGATDLYRHITLLPMDIASFGVVRENSPGVFDYWLGFTPETAETAIFATDATIHAIGF